MSERPSLASILRLLDLGDYLLPYTIRAVCILGVSEALASGPLHLTQLATVTDTHEPSIRVALKYLATRDIYAEVEPDVFGLTPMADLLRADHPYSARDIFLSPVACTRAMEGLDHSFRTGEAAFDAVHGKTMWEHLREHPADGEAFDKVMGGVTGMELRAIMRAVKWSDYPTVVDIGGGNGSFLSSLMGRFSSMRGILFDLPGVVVNAPEVFAVAGVAERARVVAGSFLVGPIPSGGDAYVLKRILYSWDDEEVVGVLKRVRAAMGPDSRLFIMEAGRTEGEATALSRRMDLLMLTLSAGGARSLAEQEKLLNRADLALVRSVPTPMFPIIEARPA